MITAAEAWIQFQSMARRSKSDRMSYKIKKAMKPEEATTGLYSWDAARGQDSNAEGEQAKERIKLEFACPVWKG